MDLFMVIFHVDDYFWAICDCCEKRRNVMWWRCNIYNNSLHVFRCKTQFMYFCCINGSIDMCFGNCSCYCREQLLLVLLLDVWSICLNLNIVVDIVTAHIEQFIRSITHAELRWHLFYSYKVFRQLSAKPLWSDWHVVSWSFQTCF